MSPMDVMVDGACVRALLAEVGAIGSHETLIYQWIMEGYTIDETAEGLLSNMAIIVPEPCDWPGVGQCPRCGGEHGRWP